MNDFTILSTNDYRLRRADGQRGGDLSSEESDGSVFDDGAINLEPESFKFDTSRNQGL